MPPLEELSSDSPLSSVCDVSPVSELVGSAPEVAEGSVEVAPLHPGQGHAGAVEEPVGGQGVLEHVDLAGPLESTGMFGLQVFEDFCVVVWDLDTVS